MVAKVCDFGSGTRICNLEKAKDLAMYLFSALKEKTTERTVVLPNWLAPEVINEEEYTEKSKTFFFIN